MFSVNNRKVLKTAHTVTVSTEDKCPVTCHDLEFVVFG